MARRAHDLLWWISFAGGAAGLGALAAGAPWGPFLAVVSAVALADLAWMRPPADRLSGLPAWLWVAGAAGGGVAVVGTLMAGAPQATRLALVALGFQALLAVAGARPGRRAGWGRRLVVLFGHATALLGVSLLVRAGAVPEALTALAGGFGLLLLHVFWTQRRAGGPGEEWEAVFLFALLAGLTAPFALETIPALAPLALAVMGGAALLALSVLARPPFDAPGMDVEPGGPFMTIVHAAVGVVAVNAVLFAYTLVSEPAVEIVLFVLFFWLLLSVLLEYRAIRRARRRIRARGAPAEVDVPPGLLTVLVTAADEPETLRLSMEANLRLASPVRFVVVVARRAWETLRVARGLEAAHPGRVSVVEARAGTKPGDLNEAWPLVDTPYLVLLDSDETIDDAFLRRGCAILATRPKVGLVQGRKAARAPDESSLARFVSAERRFSTWIDHPMQAEDGAAHFGGSGAMVRWAALFDVEGLSEDALTEDIDLTLRLFLRTDWSVEYEPSMVVREANPRGWLPLLRQRSRWARGWAQVTRLHLPEVWRQSRRLGPGRTVSLAWQLLAAVSAPWCVLLPLLVLLRAAGLHPLFPLAVAVPLALVILPARFVAFAYAAWTDPVIPAPRRPLRWLELVLHAYGWILFGWITQLHALYLEAAGAPRVWHVTEKRPHQPPSRRAAG